MKTTRVSYQCPGCGFDVMIETDSPVALVKKCSQCEDVRHEKKKKHNRVEL